MINLVNSDIWRVMVPIDLEKMKSVQLMNRIDTKFIAHRNKLLPILNRAADMEYMVQYNNGAMNPYDTIYYDTEDMEMYLMHHNQRLNRQKIRLRTYKDSNVSFLEIKNKNNKGRTNKIRISISDANSNVLKNDSKAIKFIKSNTKYSLNELFPTLKTYFHRITLVNKNKTERITVDVNLQFYNYVSGKSNTLKDIIIIELKQDGRYVSQMREILMELGVKPFKISKYGIGTALTNPYVKSNRFHPKIHLINKLINKTINHEQLS